MFLSRLGFLLCVAAAVVAAWPEAKAADNAPPTIDLQARCKRSEKAVIDMMGDPSLKESAFNTCMRAEQEAHDALAKAWPQIPANYKTFCIRKRDYSPSYVEWIACLEMMIDLRKQRANSGAALDRVSKGCPVIEYRPDGSIKSIRACSL